MAKQSKLSPSETAEVESLLKLKANKKLIQNHLQLTTGKKVVLKDIHNVARHHHKQNDYQELVAEMKKVKGNLAGRKLSGDSVLESPDC